MEIFDLASVADTAAGAYWRCHCSSREFRTQTKLLPHVRGGLSSDHPQWFPPWRQQTGSGRPRWLPVCRRCFLDGGDFPRSAQSVPTLGTFKDRTSGPLPPRWKTSKSAYSRTWDKSDSLKKQVPHTWYQSKQTPLSMMRRSTTCRRRG